MKTAILVDGDFFLHRYRSLYPESVDYSPSEIAQKLWAGALGDLQKINARRSRGDGENDRGDLRAAELYRVFFYDCPPLDKVAHNPISKRAVDFGKSDKAKSRKQLHKELVRLRKFALRLGRVSDNTRWTLCADKEKELLAGRIQVSDLVESDVYYDVRQKGVDMRIGLDIASLAYKRAVSQIILIAGDSDFVPAAKLARREGIDFVLDPMWNHINPDLYEHIDGLVSCWRRPKNGKAPSPAHEGRDLAAAEK